MDLLEITGLKVKTYIGVADWEQSIAQTLLIDIKIPINCAGLEDSIESTVNYDLIVQHINKQLENSSFQLIESIANTLAMSLKEQFKLEAIVLTVHKPHAIPSARDVSICINR